MSTSKRQTSKKKEEKFSNQQIDLLKSILEEYTSKIIAKKLQTGSLVTVSEKTKKNLEIFTKKEFQIIKLICEEYSSSEIAKKLKLSPRTIEGYRNQIIVKSNSRNVVGLVKFAIKNKIYTLK